MLEDVFIGRNMFFNMENYEILKNKSLPRRYQLLVLNLLNKLKDPPKILVIAQRKNIIGKFNPALDKLFDNFDNVILYNDSNNSPRVIRFIYFNENILSYLSPNYSDGVYTIMRSMGIKKINNNFSFCNGIVYFYKVKNTKDFFK